MKGKKILLAISGSIAAYKSAYLIRSLIKEGAEVVVVMTEAAQLFISPLTLSTLSKNKVHTSVTDGETWDNHVELGLWADVILVAPATANTLAKMANGICDNIISAVYLSAKCPVFFAPAMDRDMWKHPSTQNNIAKLLDYGNHLIDAEEGELASGLIGKGRMAEPENILTELQKFFQKSNDLAGKSVLITAGPTYEALDPVRYIGNHSSGKMGIELAKECANRGADVSLILGPSHLKLDHPNVLIKRVFSGEEMFVSCKEVHSEMDLCIFAAAVADYRPQTVAQEKIKKKGENLEIVLERTTDIAMTLGQEKRDDQIHIGFALETQNEEVNAKRKLEKKNFDMIVLNSMRDKGAGFKHNTNKVTLFLTNGNNKSYDLKTKSEVAKDIIDTFVDNFTK